GGPLADEEEGGEEEPGGVAEAGERLVEVEHAGRPEAERRCDCDDGYREAVEDEHDDDRREHDEGDGRVAHDERSVRARTPGRGATRCARTSRDRAGSRSGTRPRRTGSR